MSEVKTVTEAKVIVQGVKKKQRKVKNHYFDLGDHEFPITEETKKLLIESAKEEVTHQMRSYGDKIILKLQKIEVDPGVEGGLSSRSFMMFQDEEKIEIELSA
jgi:hypothetical protein